MAEAAPTVSAPVGPLACVRALVLNQLEAVAEALPAVRAGVGFLSSVDVLV